MKTKSFFIMLLVLFASINAKAANGDTFRIDVGDGEDHLWLTLTVLDEDQKSAEVTSTDYAWGTCEIPDQANGYTIVSIGDNAFKNQTDLAKVVIPETVTSIGASAFKGCTALGTLDNPVVVPTSVTSVGVDAFKDTWWLDYTLPDGLVYINNILYAYKGEMPANSELAIKGGTTEILPSVFEDQENLASIFIPASVSIIGSEAFNGCSSLTSVTVQNPTPTTINSNTFTNAANATLYVPQGPAFPAYQNANYWKDFGTITYAPETVTFYVSAKESSSSLAEVLGEEYTRYYCDIKLIGTINSYDMMIMRNKMVDLLRLDLSETSIVANSYNYGTGVSQNNVFPDFLKTTKLTSLILPNTITQIGNDAFYSSTLHFSSITIPASVTGIGNNAFRNNNRVLTVTFEDNSQISYIGAYAFYNLSSTNFVNMPETLGTIGDYAFYQCSKIAPKVVGRVGQYAFYNCPSITSITVNGTIASYAFQNCNNLESADITTSSLGAYAFAGCTKLKTVSASIMGSSIYFYTDANNSKPWGYHAFDDCPIETFTFCRDIPNNRYFADYNKGVTSTLETIILNEGVTSIPNNAFSGCSNVTSVSFPSTLSSIGGYAFQQCRLSSAYLPEGISLSDHAYRSSGLTGELVLPKSLKEIPEGCFYGNSITSVKLSPNTTKIGKEAFAWNKEITEIRLPSTLTSISDNAFSNCTNLKAVYAYMPDIITIGSSTFPNYQTSKLYVPSFLYNFYYYDTNWSQFLQVLRCDLQPGDYETFYSNSDVLFAEGSERITEDTPIATIGSQGSITVEGEAQVFDTVDQTVDDSYSASLIGDGETAATNNIPMNELRVNIAVTAGKWYFFCFPFDVTIGDCTYPGRYAWRYYDGATRAANGSGGWQVVTAATLNAREGYAFQSETTGTLTVRFAAPTFGGNRTRDLAVHAATNAQHASWNFVGNPYSSYYDFGTADITSPVTVWTGSSYAAYRPGDDELHLRPYQAFFIQKPEAANSIQFNAGRRESYRQSQQMAASRAAARKAKGKNIDRLFLNLTISDNDTAAIDRTRLVLNEKASHSYELECDAAKFLSDDAAAQIYMVEDGTPMAIDERPAMGDICLGYVAKSEGTLRLEAERMDVQMVLYDNVTGKEFNLANGAYKFTTAAGTFNHRFTLRTSGEASAISSLTKQAGVAISTIDGGLSIADAEGKTVEVYTVGGSLVTRQDGNGTVSLTPGIYVVKVNGKSTKVRVD